MNVSRAPFFYEQIATDIRSTLLQLKWRTDSKHIENLGGTIAGEDAQARAKAFATAYELLLDVCIDRNEPTGAGQ